MVNSNFQNLDNDCKKLLLKWNESPSPEDGMTLEDLREGLLINSPDDKEIIGEGPKSVLTSDTLIKNRNKDIIPARIYKNKTSSFKTLLYVHGGGWVTCDIDTHDTFCKYLTYYAGINVVSINYRLAPENRFPAALEDVEDALYWIKNEKKELNTDKNFIGVGGDSAGGNLSAAISLKLRDIKKEDLLSLQLLIYPAVSGDTSSETYEKYGSSPYRLKKETMKWFWSKYIPNTEVDNPEYIEPLKAKNFNLLPSALVFTAEHDVLTYDTEEYIKRLENSDIKVFYHKFNSMPHGFVNMIGQSLKAKEYSIEIATKVKELWI